MKNHWDKYSVGDLFYHEDLCEWHRRTSNGATEECDEPTKLTDFAASQLAAMKTNSTVTLELDETQEKILELAHTTQCVQMAGDTGCGWVDVKGRYNATESITYRINPDAVIADQEPVEPWEEFAVFVDLDGRYAVLDFKGRGHDLTRNLLVHLQNQADWLGTKYVRTVGDDTWERWEHPGVSNGTVLTLAELSEAPFVPVLVRMKNPIPKK